MTYALLLLFCIVFFELFALFGLAKDAMAIIARAQTAMHVLRSPELGDDEKESHMRRGSADIFKATLRFAAKFVLIGLVLYLLFLLTVAVYPDRKEVILESIVSPVVIAMLTVGTGCYVWSRKAILARRRT
jgi:hypothetical protein